jgi:hypothetical protein
MIKFFLGTQWSGRELLWIKARVACGGIAIGIYFYNSLAPFLPYFIMTYAAFCVWTVILWLRKLKTKQ